MGHDRTERDSMGDVQVPEDALYGAHTARAIANFPISGVRFTRPFLRALGLIKSAAARANAALGVLDPDIAQAIELAAEEVASGALDAQFPVDIYQTGSGTSTNMNANEVIALQATRILGRAGFIVHPNDHVNRSQSSNDVIPACIHVAAAEQVRFELLHAMVELAESLKQKSAQFDDIVKIGRTHLQDAVPIRLGQEFGGYARQVDASLERVHAALDGIYELPLGGTAVGTGLNAPPGFAAATIRTLKERTRLPFREAQNHFEAQAARDASVFLSGALKTYAVALTKIANDLRWLGAIGELRLPAVQPGSSIMPGKVNPVIAESVLLVCAQIIGYDAAITWCAAAGNFELNVMMPVIAYDLLESIRLLTNATRNFRARLIDGLEADRECAAAFVEQSLALATSLALEIGYDKAAALAGEAYRSHRTIREVAREKSGIPEERLEQLLDPKRQTGK
jgi:fumarate hydratase class II